MRSLGPTPGRREKPSISLVTGSGMALLIALPAHLSQFSRLVAPVVARLSQQPAQAGQIAQAAGDLFHALGGHGLALFDRLIDRGDQQILQIVDPLFIVDIDHIRIDFHRLNALMPGDDDS